MNEIDLAIINLVGESQGVEIDGDFLNLVESYMSECDETFKRFVLDNGVDKNLYIESISNSTDRIEEIATSILEDDSLSRTQLRELASELLEITSHMNFDSSAISFCSSLETAATLAGYTGLIESVTDIVKTANESERINVRNAYQEGKADAYEFYLRNGHFRID